MSQRNPMNDRYQTDAHQGQTRKSAASMKPKTKAASSVRVVSKRKSKQQKKAAQRAARAKRAELERVCYNPPTAEYKKLRRIWWALLIATIFFLTVSFVGRSFLPEVGVDIAVGICLVFAMATVYVDSVKIKKVRRAYQIEMMSRKTKEQRAAEKKVKAEALAKKQNPDGQDAGEKSPEQKKKSALFGLNLALFKGKKDQNAPSEHNAGRTDLKQDKSANKTSGTTSKKGK